MKRNMDLIRTILLEIEKVNYEGGWINLQMAGYSDNEVSYHVMLLTEAGLIDAIDLSTNTVFAWAPKRLTWYGHEFIEASRDDTRWEKVKTIMKEKGGGFAFDVMKSLLITLMTKAVLGQ